MAAFEAVSTLNIQPKGGEEPIDIRKVRLPSTRPEQNDFDPMKHREPKAPIKLWMAHLNLFRTAFGAGALGLPLAISQAGIILGPIFALSTGLLIMHTHLTLLKCLNEISRQLKIPRISYRYGFKLAMYHGPGALHWFGDHGPTIIATFMMLSQIGICTVFFIFTADCLRDIMDWETSNPGFVALLVPYLLMEFFMKNLKIISYVSMTGNVMNVVGNVLVFYHIFTDPRGVVVLANFDALALLFAFGTFLFNLSGVGVMLSLDRALEDPTHLTKCCGIVTVGILGPTVITTIFGTLGYWSFGTMEENILRVLPFDDTSAMAAIGLYMLTVALTYPLQCYPAIGIVMEVLKHQEILLEKEANFIKHISRPAFVLVTFVIGYAIPFQGPFVAFVGNLCTTLLALVFPAAMELCLMYPGPYGKFNLYLIKDLLIILLGLVSWVYGAILSAYLIYIRILSIADDKEEFR